MYTIIIIITVLFIYFVLLPKVRSGKLIDFQSLKSLLNSKEKYLFLDVRTADEYSRGHIGGSKNISHEKLPQAMVKTKTKTDTKIILYCRSGQRAQIALKKLNQAGYTNVHSFGGISRWKGKLS